MRNAPPISPASIRLVLTASLAAVFLASCGDGRVSVYPVRGRILVEGQPAEHALVIFHPVDASGQLAVIKPEGRVAADGYFQLKTYREADGAPAGEYRVTIEWPGLDPDMALSADDPEHLPAAPDRLAGRYADPKTSNLQATVCRGSNEPEPFVLKHGLSQ